jgi:AcrR family transcriptional regulator
MSPRRSVAEARETRTAIVDRAVQVSSVEGLEGLTIGRLASSLQMSKSGVLGHFGSKEALQLSALEAAIAVFRREVWEPTADAEPGLPRLLAICDAWISYLERGVFPGGCFLTAAACEFDDREGAVRDAIADAMSRWYRALESNARVAIDAGDLPPGSDAKSIALQLNALAMGANQALQLFGDRRAAQTARRAMRNLLSTPEPG